MIKRGKRGVKKEKKLKEEETEGAAKMFVGGGRFPRSKIDFAGGIPAPIGAMPVYHIFQSFFHV